MHTLMAEVVRFLRHWRAFRPYGRWEARNCSNGDGI
jgi:hypothetical protein